MDVVGPYPPVLLGQLGVEYGESQHLDSVGYNG
jgi:hypothetical protein